jgi:hypothetical protein
MMFFSSPSHLQHNCIEHKTVLKIQYEDIQQRNLIFHLKSIPSPHPGHERERERERGERERGASSLSLREREREEGESGQTNACTDG